MNSVDQDRVKLQQRIAGTVSKLKNELRPWIEQHTWPEAVPRADEYPAYYELVTAALLETAIERYIGARAPADAIDLIMACFQRQAKKMGQHPT